MLQKLRLYWPLIKASQTGLLLATGVAGYLSVRTTPDVLTLAGLAGSLFLAISGSTVLNMWWDRDIDACMQRTQKRPTSRGAVSGQEVLRLGLVLSVLGVGWAAALGALYGLVVFAGLFFDVVVYSMWLKRRTCWSIVWGGISGAMPVLANAVVTPDVEPDCTSVWAQYTVGVLLAAAVLFWIPTHTLTFSLKFARDYAAAGVPTFPSTYGVGVTRAMIALSSILAALSMGAAGVLVGLQTGVLGVLGVLSAGLLVLSFAAVLRPSDRVNFRLFKYASLYMLVSMVLLTL